VLQNLHLDDLKHILSKIYKQDQTYPRRWEPFQPALGALRWLAQLGWEAQNGNDEMQFFHFLHSSLCFQMALAAKYR